MKYFFIILLFISEPVFLYSQDNKTPVVTIEEEILEPLNENSDEEADATNYLEELKYHIENPIDLNTASDKDFEKLQILTPFQIYSIIEYREKKGLFVSVNELNGVDGISKETYNIIKQFVKVNIEPEQSKQNNNFHQTILFNSGETLEKQKGYNSSDTSVVAFEGSPIKLRSKYRIEKGDFFQAGLTVEKDPGETLFSKSNKTFDFVSGFIKVQNLSYIKNAVVGDFTANFGQGLVVWNGFASGRSSFSVNTRKSKEGFDKFSSFDENRYFRGLAISSGKESLDVSAFFSSKKIDATIVSKDNSGKVAQISTIQTSGYHNTLSEIENEDALGEITSGLNATFDKDKIKIGATLMHVKYNADIVKSDQLYKKYAFSGNNLTCGSIDYLLRFRRFEIFGEAARNSKNGNAFLNGLSIEIIPEFSMSFIHRFFEKTYNSPYANAFAQNNKATNENGFYSGFIFTPIRGIEINSYFDFFRFPFIKYQVSAPSSGVNYFSSIKIDLLQNISFSFRYSYSKKQEDGTSDLSNIPVLEDKYNKKFRFVVSYKISPEIELRNRAELSNYKKGNVNTQNGYLLLQDFVWKPEKKRLTFTTRYAVFETESYENSIYTYENEVQYSYSVPALYGKGSRFYAMVKYSYKRMNCWLRYSTTYYNDRDVISTGLNEISGNKKSDVTLQVIYEF